MISIQLTWSNAWAQVTIAQEDIKMGIHRYGPIFLTITLVVRVTTVNTVEWTSVAVFTPVIPKPKSAGKLSEMAFATWYILLVFLHNNRSFRSITYRCWFYPCLVQTSSIAQMAWVLYQWWIAPFFLPRQSIWGQKHNLQLLWLHL